jgi:hypothetical protein
MSGYVVAVVGAVLLLGFMFELLRRRRLREKYAALWIGMSVVIIAGVALPGLLESTASALGVTVPVNLVFFVGLLVLLLVCVQLSAEVSSLEQESQTLAEELALLRHRLEKLEADGRAEQGGAPETPGPGGR